MLVSSDVENFPSALGNTWIAISMQGMNLTAGEQIDPEYCGPLRVPIVIIVPVLVITLPDELGTSEARY